MRTNHEQIRLAICTFLPEHLRRRSTSHNPFCVSAAESVGYYAVEQLFGLLVICRFVNLEREARQDGERLDGVEHANLSAEQYRELLPYTKSCLGGLRKVCLDEH